MASTDRGAGWAARLRSWARGIKTDAVALALAAGDRRVPWYAKLAAAMVAAYALSPIDLIPDFIPVLGYLDEVILLPPLILLAIRLVPPEVMARHRAAAMRARERPVSRAGVAMILGIWLLAAAALLWWLWPHAAR